MLRRTSVLLVGAVFVLLAVWWMLKARIPASLLMHVAPDPPQVRFDRTRWLWARLKPGEPNSRAAMRDAVVKMIPVGTSIVTVLRDLGAPDEAETRDDVDSFVSDKFPRGTNIRLSYTLFDDPDDGPFCIVFAVDSSGKVLKTTVEDNP